MTAAFGPTPAGRPREAGFTLVEILVGLLISTLIMAGMSMVMKAMDMGWEATAAALDRRDTLATSLDVVSGDISRIERAMARGPEPRRFLFRGSPAEMIYLLAERPIGSREGLYWVRLSVRAVQQQAALIRQRAPYEPEQQDLARIDWSDEVVLISGRIAIGLSYRAPGTGSGSWSDSWKPTDRLPEQVKLLIVDRRSDEPLVPALIQTLRLTAEVDCVVPEAGTCTLRTKGRIGTGERP